MRNKSGWFNYRPEHALASQGISAKQRYITKKLEARGNGKPRVIIDLDSTIANISFRVNAAKMVDPEMKSERFFKALFNPKMVKQDRPIKGTAEFLKRISKKYDIVYVTGRPPRMSQATKKWLEINGYPEGTSFYRPTGTSTREFKFETMSNIDNTILSIGDNLDGHDRFASRKNGITFIKVRANKPWNFDAIERTLERKKRNVTKK
jgi:predicted secreted acid phosphatase